MASPPHKRKAPLLKTFWRRFGLDYNIDVRATGQGCGDALRHIDLMSKQVLLCS